MPKFRKKPVVIEAARFDGVLIGEWDRRARAVKPGTCPEWFPAVIADLHTEHMARAVAEDPEGSGVAACRDALFIRTLEGVMRAGKGDWIIRGVAGELYPCRPDIFAKTYEPVT